MELGRITERFNGIANVFQGFVGIDAKNNKQRGVNSYQLVFVPICPFVQAYLKRHSEWREIISKDADRFIRQKK